VGHAFVEAIARRDWAALERCFAPDVHFQAVVPNAARPFRDKPDAASAVEQIRKWFSDADPLVLADSEVGMIADRLAIRYRFTGHDPDGDFVVEQDAFAEVSDGRVVSMRLVCSGFINSTPAAADS
jgi:hypothetical protein